jgi:Protein of unknown function (DUF2958)
MTPRLPREGVADNAGDLSGEVTSTFQRRPCYRWIRRADKLPTYAELGDRPFTEIVCAVKLFNPTGAGRWWIGAFDPDSRIAWGVAEIFEREVGSFDMDELVAFRGLMAQCSGSCHQGQSSVH